MMRVCHYFVHLLFLAPQAVKDSEKKSLFMAKTVMDKL